MKLIPVGSWRDARAPKALRDELEAERGGCFPFGKREAKLTEIEHAELPRQVVLQVPEARLGVIIGKNGCMIKRILCEF